ncbi:MAG: putative DNA-binding domain-containing protein [Rickettsiales bacterium]|nr:putative DNA-binding domain-containing protein [Rickettsiales bacterium]
MTKLLTIQRNFSKHLEKKSDQKILQEISGSSVEALARLNIYRNNVYGGFESVLSSIFPVTKNILGEEKFAELLKKYCQKFPSKTGDLNKFGDNFAKFLKGHKPLYLKDLAQLELLHHQAYFIAKNTKEFDVRKFQKLPVDHFFNLVFLLDSSRFLFNSKFAVFSIWQKKREIKNLAKAELALVCADNIFKLSEEEFLFLSLIQKQKKLYEIYQILCKKTKKPVDIGALINRFISNGTIINYARI